MKYVQELSRSSSLQLSAFGGGDGPDDGCNHDDYGEESGPDSSETDSGSSHGDGNSN